MKILITTGIYPPAIGGPAQYAKNLASAFTELGHQVSVKTYGLENKLPTGLRHLYFFFKIWPAVWGAELIVALDTFSVGLPTVLAGKLFRKKVLIRTGGDFLWEGYVERTGDLVLLSKFYQISLARLSWKEKIIFSLTKLTLKNCYRLVFSTDWQRQIWQGPYELDLAKTAIIENYYGPKQGDREAQAKVFVASARKLVWKNLAVLRTVFEGVRRTDPEAELFLDNLPFDQFMAKISACYCVILTSLGDISPNMILDAIRYNRPFICTSEVGIYDRIKEAGLFVDPLDQSAIVDAVRGLLSTDGYERAKAKVRSFDFEHGWDDIAREFIEI